MDSLPPALAADFQPASLASGLFHFSEMRRFWRPDSALHLDVGRLATAGLRKVHLLSFSSRIFLGDFFLTVSNVLLRTERYFLGQQQQTGVEDQVITHLNISHIRIEDGGHYKVLVISYISFTFPFNFPQ